MTEVVERNTRPTSSAAAPAVESGSHPLTRVPWGVGLFMFSMISPLIMQVGELRLSPYRLLLLLYFVPLVIALLSGRAGRIRAPDIFVFLLCLWTCVVLTWHQGLSTAVEPSGIFLVETFGAYLLGRILIRDAASFRGFAVIWFSTVLVLAPVVVVEALTGRNILLELFQSLGSSRSQVNMEQRLGLDRAQGTFQHPILLGVYCGAAVSLTYFVVCYRRTSFTRALRTLLVLGTASTCLSSGPLAAMVGQVGMILWNKVFKRVDARWWLLAGCAAFCWVFVDVFSNRSPPKVFISYFALNEGSAYNRIRIWQFGSQSVLNHPLFGVGYGSWERPAWMPGSMDMFWLVGAVRYGLPGGLLTFITFLWIFLRVAFKKGLDDAQNAYRLGFLSSIVGIFLVGWTVHFWNETYVVIFFLAGAGVWFLDAQPEADHAAASNTRRRPVTALTRFPRRSEASSERSQL